MSDSSSSTNQMPSPWSALTPFWSKANKTAPLADAMASGGPLAQYMLDTHQRSVLFLDTLRQRGDEQKDITSRPMATVLAFEHEILMSGRSLKRPINYALSRIIPPSGQTTDLTKRPVVVIDPRAGQGPGIGGFKASSEIGNALAEGRAVYFIGFSAKPEPGQTFLDVVEGQVEFFERIVEIHPDSPRPFVIGNCQAGYQTLMVAMLRPDLFGPCMVAGSPISYWQGEHGKNPMRYAGGLLGGSWMTSLISDLGMGKFDGTWLILNFDNLNPANWLWDKQYDLYKNIDQGVPRYLGFEKWWGDFITLNGQEIQYLVDEMFIADKLTRNQLKSSDGTVFDLRDIETPIIVFTSKGDNISPPPQTLGWILDLYKDVQDMQVRDRTVVYCVNQNVGHLAIFVSSKVGAKEDAEMLRLMDVIDCLPPGLFELIINPSSEEEIKAGKPAWNSHFELRTLEDIRAFGRNSQEDDRAFEAAKRVSILNNSLYRMFLQPAIKASTMPGVAEMLFKYNPLRMSYTAFASDNFYMRGVSDLAKKVHAERKPVSTDNIFLQMQENISSRISSTLDGYRAMRDKMKEQTFFSFYGSPILQGFLGMKPDENVRELPGLTPQERCMHEQKAAEVKAKVNEGGFEEALIRSLLYVLSCERRLDQRGLTALQAIRVQLAKMPITEFKTLVRMQFFVLLLNREAAITALLKLVPDQAKRHDLIQLIIQTVGADGTILPSEDLRINEISKFLNINTANVETITVREDEVMATGLPAFAAAPAPTVAPAVVTAPATTPVIMHTSKKK